MRTSTNFSNFVIAYDKKHKFANDIYKRVGIDYDFYRLNPDTFYHRALAKLLPTALVTGNKRIRKKKLCKAIGMLHLGFAMAEPIRQRMNYTSFARQVFQVEQI